MQLPKSWITWAEGDVQNKLYRKVYSQTSRYPGGQHWSRRFEYPWILICGEFKPGMLILDAAGSNAPMQKMLKDSKCRVVNADLNIEKNDYRYSGVTEVQADLRQLPFADKSFDRVICISVLEHIEKPWRALEECWRVTKSNGRMLVTVDVANYRKDNHTIDLYEAKNLIKMFHLDLPKPKENLLWSVFPEKDAGEHEPKEVYLQVLCFYVDKE